MPSTNNRLKVCTFNAKCDELDNKCCVTDHCYSGKSSGVPDSLKAVMLAITLLPHKADIYNLQNVDACVVPHLLKEFCRVKTITDRLDDHSRSPDSRLKAEQFEAVCDLNNLTGLCPDAVKFREALIACGEIDCLNYTDDLRPLSEDENPALNQVYKYVGVDEYDAYHNGCVLTLVRKSLNLCPTAKEIPCVDSLVLFFEHEGRRFINVNVSLGGLSLSVEGTGCKAGKVNAVVCWLNKYKDCGSFIMSGALGDLDYDLDQLLYRGDALLPEFAQIMTSKNVENGSAPSSFPCNPEDPVFQLLEYLLKTCNAEHIPYSWLLQYLRVSGHKRCCAYEIVHGKKKHGSRGDSCDSQAIYDRRKDSGHRSSPVVNHNNRAALRAKKADKCGRKSAPKKSCCGSCAKGGSCESKKHESPKKSCCTSCKRGGVCESKKPQCEDRCVPGNNKCIKRCKCVCKDDKCCVPLKTPCKPKKKDCECWKKKDCDCCDTPYSVKVDVCRDFCDKKCNPCEPTCVDKCRKSCCSPCKRKCQKNCKSVCDCDPCEEEKCPPYCDTLSVLKRELCLYNTLDKVEDVNDRYTGYYDHFNKCLDCRYPRGIFQAWAMCEEYCLPKWHSRKIDNNSELLALDHILVSDCIKSYVSCSELSELKTEGDENARNAVRKNPFKPVSPAGTLLEIANMKVAGEVPDYSGVCVRSFFPNRVYCVDLRFPCETDCEYECGVDLHALGIKSLWCALDRWGTCEVDIDLMREFCLDTHPFYEHFFYNTLRNKFQDKDLQGRYDREFGVCRKDNVVMRFRKKSKMTDCEFYDAMVCAYTNAENKDRFVVTVAFLEAVVRAVRNGDVENVHCAELNALYDFLDVCFSGKLKLREYLDSYLNISEGAVTVDVDVDTVNNTGRLVACLISTLHPYLVDNCRLMEVLIRRASEALDMSEWCEVPLDELSPAKVEEWQEWFVDANSDYLKAECQENPGLRAVKKNLPTNVSSYCSIVWMIENCVLDDAIIDFLMNITVSNIFVPPV
jgi:hypothetical protein